MRGGHQFYSWHGVPVRVEWYDGPLDVSNITSPAEHPTGEVQDGERHGLVEILSGGRPVGFWSTVDAVETHAERIGPTELGGELDGESGVNTDI